MITQRRVLKGISKSPIPWGVSQFFHQSFRKGADLDKQEV
jgi:hypothetical protein